MSEALSLFDPGRDAASASPPFRGDRATVAQVLSWFRDNNPRPARSTKGEIERRRVRDLFAADFGGRLITDVRAFDLLAWINRNLPPRRSAWTRRRWNSTIQAPFNAAARLGLIDRNPFDGLSMPEGPCGRDWTDEEFRALLRCSPPPLRRMIVFIRFSGSRPGEARELTWPCVRNEVRAMVLAEHKTVEHSRAPRVIRFNRVIVKLLGVLRRGCPPHNRHVFLNSYLNQWTLDSLTRAIRHSRARAGLPPDVKLHGGRHTYGTQAILNGVNPAVLAQLMGHSSIRTTQRYVHLAAKDDFLAEASEMAIG